MTNLGAWALPERASGVRGFLRWLERRRFPATEDVILLPFIAMDAALVEAILYDKPVTSGVWAVDNKLGAPLKEPDVYGGRWRFRTPDWIKRLRELVLVDIENRIRGAMVYYQSKSLSIALAALRDKTLDDGWILDLAELRVHAAAEALRAEA